MIKCGEIIIECVCINSIICKYAPLFALYCFCHSVNYLFFTLSSSCVFDDMTFCVTAESVCSVIPFDFSIRRNKFISYIAQYFFMIGHYNFLWRYIIFHSSQTIFFIYTFTLLMHFLISHYFFIYFQFIPFVRSYSLNRNLHNCLFFTCLQFTRICLLFLHNLSFFSFIYKFIHSVFIPLCLTAFFILSLFL